MTQLVLKNNTQAAMLEAIGSDAVRVQLKDDIESSQKLEEIRALLDDLLNRGVSQIVFDMTYVRQGGFGLHIIRRSVDDITYCSDPVEW